MSSLHLKWKTAILNAGKPHFNTAIIVRIMIPLEKARIEVMEVEGMHFCKNNIAKILRLDIP